MLFSGVTYFTIYGHLLFLFPMVSGFFSLLLIYIAAQMWLGTTRVVIGNALKLQSSMLGVGRVQEIAFSDIASIGDKITAQQGGENGTAYYDIVLKKQDGRTVTLGSTLPSKREAEWLVSEMQRLVGPAAKRVGASAAV